MVESLPAVAVSLCGSSNNSTLPNEACAYFAKEDEIYKFQQQINQEDEKEVSGSSSSEIVLPYSITFQAHPEYMTSTGYKINYVKRKGNEGSWIDYN